MDRELVRFDKSYIPSFGGFADVKKARLFRLKSEKDTEGVVVAVKILKAGQNTPDEQLKRVRNGRLLAPYPRI